MNKELEEAIKRLKAIKDAKLDSDTEIALFELVEDSKYINLILNYIENSIHKDKIREKIDELQKQYKEALEENSTKAFILKCQIEILKEVLEWK